MQADDRSGPSVVLPPPSSGIKRTHAEMAQRGPRNHSPLFVEPRATDQPEPSSHPRLMLPPLEPSIRSFNPERPRRAVDANQRLRRTVDPGRSARTTSSVTRNVIDLTDAAYSNTLDAHAPGSAVATTPTASPARTSIFIDLSADSSPPRPSAQEPDSSSSRMSGTTRRMPHTHTAANRIPSLRRETSDDLVFVEERPAPQPQHLPLHDLTQDNHGGHDYRHHNDDDIIETGATGPRVNQPTPTVNARQLATSLLTAGSNMALDGLAQLLQSQNTAYVVRRIEAATAAFRFGQRGQARHVAQLEQLANRRQLQQRGSGVGAFRPPPRLDYHEVGFPFHWAVGPPEVPREREASPYQAPDPPMLGFTGTPGEDEVVVCPCCGDELATGDSDEKKQVCVIKACGHVYCGYCMSRRSKSKVRSSKGKAKAVDSAATTKTFSKCLVPGCESKVTSKGSVLQLFL